MKSSLIYISTEFNSSSSGLPVLEVSCGAAQLLQMEVGTLGSVVVCGEIVDKHVIVKGKITINMAYTNI